MSGVQERVEDGVAATDSQDGGEPRGARAHRALRLSGLALPAAWLAIVVAFSLWQTETFATTANFQTIFGSQAVLVVLALGLLIPMSTGDFDISVAQMLSLSSMLVAVLNGAHGWPLWLAALASLGAAIVVGSVNALLVVGFELNSFIVTIGMSSVLTGVVYSISGGRTISGVDPTLSHLVVLDTFLGLAPAFWFGVVLCAAIWFLFAYTPLGRRILFTGRGRNVARLSGIRVTRVRAGALVASAIIAALAGVCYTGTLGGADPTSGDQFLFPAFAAVFLGSTSIQPGRFNPWGTLIAVYFLVTGITGLQLLGAQGYVQYLFYGLALIVAVTLSQLVRIRSARDEASAGA
ncbi:ABC transporter permease [Amycolatopsis viridis]|uniref:Ribose transport system permease protein n=1 Tax=Amycolatopsis viridis TaxID=185678 RepID=A0ABX0SPK2_9PSEU|nr:ABC transporter permease [Amycolatopsis viridis]NIH78474.1 ribose transport system permease protein [Amycolatopsis viridis]